MENDNPFAQFVKPDAAPSAPAENPFAQFVKPAENPFAQFTKPAAAPTLDSAMPPQGEPSDVAASAKSAGDYLKTGASQLATGAKEAYQGAKETVTGFPERYAAAESPPGVEEGPLGRVITGPAYRAGMALMDSPAGEAAFNIGAATGFSPLDSTVAEKAMIKARQAQMEGPAEAGPAAAGAKAPAEGQNPFAQFVEPKIGPTEKPVGGQVAPLELPSYQDTPQKPPATGAAPAINQPPTIKGPPPAPGALGAATPNYPELHALGQEGGKGLIQQRLGIADREATQAITQLEPFQKQFNQLPREKRLDAMGYMENRSKGATIAPELKPAADAMRSVYKDIEYKWEALKPDMQFVEDYFRHNVKQPEKLNAFMSSWKEGSARGAGQKRIFPTVKDLTDAGHELVNDNPVEATMDYAMHMSRYLGSEEAFGKAREQGAVKYYKPGSAKIPEGWVPLQGRHGEPTPQSGLVAHAPREFAKPWNAFAGEGFNWRTAGGTDVMQSARQITNMATGIKLMSGYHALTMGAASFSSELARSFKNLAAGRPVEAGKSLGSAATILKPILGDVAKGWRGTRIYSGEGMEGAPIRGAMSRFLAREGPEENKVVDFLGMSNFRPSKIDKSMSMNMQGNLLTAIKRGALSGQLNQYKSMVADAPGVMKSIPIAKGIMELTGRTVQTIMAPLFEKFIPMLKMGRAMTIMSDFLRDNPSASFEDIMQQARVTQRNMDDRFGEMVQDNLFWNNKLKESLQVAMLSYSWNVGIGRALGGGVRDIENLISGSGPAAGKFTDRAAYALAFPIGAAYLGAVYQYMKTGKTPGQGTGSVTEALHDMYAPHTGGVNPVNKHRQKTPERALIPGHMKDINTLMEVVKGDKGPLDVAKDKLTPALTLLGNLATGTDWKRQPTADPESWVGSRIMQHLEAAGAASLPIPVEGLMHPLVGSGFNMFETVMGVRRAPDFLQDPTGHGDTMRYLANKDWVTKRTYDMKQAEKEGDYERAGIIKQEIRKRQNAIKTKNYEPLFDEPKK